MTPLKPTLTVLGLLAISGAALAMSIAPDADLNADGMYSLEEMLAVMPDLSEETFSVADTNGDGLVDADELAVATEAGLFPATDS